MTIDEAVEKLNGNEYGIEGSKELWSAMKAAGLVAVFGSSDDLMEFRGAINEEIGSYEGTIAYVTRYGLKTNCCENERCPYYLNQLDKATTIKAKWDSGGFSWQYETVIPHKKFVIKEDGEPYCEGIVFALSDVS